MKFLIAGFGSIGRRHMRNLIALGYDDIVLYRTRKSTLDDAEIGDFPVEYDLDEALKKHKPDAVIIANPTSLHMDVALQSAKAGCHIFMEKPISHDFEGVSDLKSLLKENNKQLFTGFQFRFHPGLKRIRRILSDNFIGRPVSVRAHWGEFLPNWHPWEDYRKSYSARKDLGGGVVLTLCHPLDYLRWLLGEIDSVWAFTGQLSDLELQVEDTAEIGLRFENGVIGSVNVNYCQQPPVHKLEIVCTGGTIQWNNAVGDVNVYIAETEEWCIYHIPEDFDRNHLFLDEMKHFVDVIQEKQEPICTVDDGIRSLKIVEAVHKSNLYQQLIKLN
jgi:predicted dehydrogenase